MDKNKLNQKEQIEANQSDSEVNLNGTSTVETADMEGTNIAAELESNMDALYQNLDTFNNNVEGI